MNLLTWPAASCPSMSSLQSFWTVPSPHTPRAFYKMEQAVQITAGQVADQILGHHPAQLHHDPEFVRQAVEQDRANSPVPMVHKGLKEVSVLLSGGTRFLLKTPYLRPDRRGKPGRKRSQRGPKGVGRDPMLEAVGIRDGVSPATRSQLALYTVQAGSYQEAITLLSQRGLSVDASTLARIASSTAQADIALRPAHAGERIHEDDHIPSKLHLAAGHLDHQLGNADMALEVFIVG